MPWDWDADLVAVCKIFRGKVLPVSDRRDSCDTGPVYDSHVSLDTNSRRGTNSFDQQDAA